MKELKITIDKNDDNDDDDYDDDYDDDDDDDENDDDDCDYVLSVVPFNNPWQCYGDSHRPSLSVQE
ncbi:MAG: hypothetical protein ACKPKO_59520 [Candidatus Fonsibacter sp.]